MYEKPDPFPFLNHRCLRCAGTNAFCSNAFDDLRVGTWVAAGEQNSSFLLGSGAVPVELPSRGNSEPGPTVPLGFRVVSAVVVTTQEWKQKASGVLVTLRASWQCSWTAELG